MSLIIVESFDLIDTAHLGAKGWSPQGAATVVAGGRHGQGAQAALDSSNAVYLAHQVSGAQNNATLTVGFAVKLTGYGTTSGPLAIAQFLGDNNLTKHVTLGVDSAGVLAVFRGTQAGTLLGSGGFVPLGTWVYVELLITLSATVGVVKLNLNGGSVLNLINQNTKNGGTATVLDTVRIGNTDTGNGSGSTTWVFDDMYLTNADGSGAQGMLGDVHVEAVLPSNNGANSALINDLGNSTNNYTHIDSATPQTTTYVQSTNVGDKDTYLHPALTEASGTVYGVQVVAWAEKTDTGSASLASVIRSGGADHEGSTTALSTGPAYVQQVWETDPATSVAWTVGGVNAAEIGVQSGS